MFQDQFDIETDHGRNGNKQPKGEKKISDALIKSYQLK